MAAADPTDRDPEVEAEWSELIVSARQCVADRNIVDGRVMARRALALDPSRPEPYNLLGALLELAGDWMAAQKFYRSALDMDPTYEPAWRNLCRTGSWDKWGEIDLGADEKLEQR